MGIWIAAGIASLLATLILGAILFRQHEACTRRLLLMTVLAGLPLSAVAFHGVRQPIDSWLGSALHHHQGLLAAIRLGYAPLTEEPAKLLILLLPSIWRRVDRGNLVHLALAIGLGFGIGEAWMLAGLLSARPEIAALPWHGLQGFIFERTLVCLTHAAFTSVALLGLVQRRWRPGLCAIAAAMACHGAANLPIWLAGHGAFGWGRAAWNAVLACWVQACVLVSAIWLLHLAGWSPAYLLLRYRVRCPGCGAIHRPSLIAVNLLDRRYEICPACRTWQTITVKDVLPRDETAADAGRDGRR